MPPEFAVIDERSAARSAERGRRAGDRRGARRQRARARRGAGGGRAPCSRGALRRADGGARRRARQAARRRLATARRRCARGSRRALGLPAGHDRGQLDRRRSAPRAPATRPGCARLRRRSAERLRDRPRARRRPRRMVRRRRSSAATMLDDYAGVFLTAEGEIRRTLITTGRRASAGCDARAVLGAEAERVKSFRRGAAGRGAGRGELRADPARRRADRRL